MSNEQQKPSGTQDSGGQTGQPQQPSTPIVTVDISVLRPEPTNTSHYSTRTETNINIQKKNFPTDE